MVQIDRGGIVGRSGRRQQRHEHEEDKQRNSDDGQGLMLEPVAEGGAGHGGMIAQDGEALRLYIHNGSRASNLT
jgi:hypothetical protein